MMQDPEKGPSVPKFYNRKKDLLLLSMERIPLLLNIYGVPGIGKSRLLKEAAERLRMEAPRAVLIQVDLKSMNAGHQGLPERLITTIAMHEPSRLRGTWKGVDQAAANIVQQMNEIAVGSGPKVPVCLFVDTTESVHKDVSFWIWLEKNVIEPLVLAGKVRQVFAGRLPIPLRRIENRRAVQRWPLRALSDKEGDLELLAEVLVMNNPSLKPEEIEQAAPLIRDLSFGHPLLMVKLATFAATRLPQELEHPQRLCRELSQNVVSQFISSYLLEGHDLAFVELLQWASVLRHFELELLARYLKRVDKALIAGSHHETLPAIVGRLMNQEALIWCTSEGWIVHEALRDILRRHLAVLQPDKFTQAVQAASEVCRELAKEMPEQSEDALYFEDEAGKYEKEWTGLVRDREEK